MSNSQAFINYLNDMREETEKDIWYAKNIPGVKIRATLNSKTNRLNFIGIPIYYRDTVKRYFRTIITKKAFSTCYNVSIFLKYFFNVCIMGLNPSASSRNL